MLPGCEAWMVQVPLPSNLAVAPETVQILAVAEVKTTVSPELAVAFRATVLSAYSFPMIGGKLMVCF